MRVCGGNSCLWHGSDEGLLPSTYYRKYFCSIKYLPCISSPAGYPWGAGCGIRRPPISLGPVPPPQQDLSHVAPPAYHGASAGRNRPRGPCGLSQRPSVFDVPGYHGNAFSGRRLYRLVPRVGPTGLAAVAAGVSDDYAISREPGGSPGGGGGPREHRLAVSAAP